MAKVLFSTQRVTGPDGNPYSGLVVVFVARRHSDGKMLLADKSVFKLPESGDTLVDFQIPMPESDVVFDPGVYSVEIDLSATDAKWTDGDYTVWMQALSNFPSHWNSETSKILTNDIIRISNEEVLIQFVNTGTGSSAFVLPPTPFDVTNLTC